MSSSTSGAEEIDSKKSHVGGCILASPSGEVPGNLYQVGDVVPTDEYKPFTKKLSVYGITLIGRENISDDFMRNVAKTIKEMFPRKKGIDTKLQKEVLRNLYRYRVAIPLFKGDPGFDSEEDWDTYRNVKRQNSVCDIIIEGEPGRQVMEVIEHILHHATNVGLHYAFPDEWGISKSSKLYQLMLVAVDKGYYDDTSYDSIDVEETRLRVKLQEFAYIIITTAWDLQEPYGGGGNEWTQGGTIASSDDLKAQFPKGYQLYEETVAKVMAAPSNSMLDKLFGQYASDSKKGDLSVIVEAEKAVINILVYPPVPSDRVEEIKGALDAAADEFGSTVPIHVQIWHRGKSDMDRVREDWRRIVHGNVNHPRILEEAQELFKHFGDAASTFSPETGNGHIGGHERWWNARKFLQAAELEKGDHRKIAAHEYFHVYQNAFGKYDDGATGFLCDPGVQNPEEYVRWLGPMWLEEGSAEYAAALVAAKNGWIDFKQAMKRHMETSRQALSHMQTPYSLQDLETAAQKERFFSNDTPVLDIDLGVWAIAYLVHLKGEKAVLVDYYEDIVELEAKYRHKGWRKSFEKNLGLSVEDFYNQFNRFNRFLLLELHEQLKILKDY